MRFPNFAVGPQGTPDRFKMGQSPGTHWYHAHKHGSTSINVMNGMVGAFVIEGDYDDALKKTYPDLQTTEKVLVVHNVGDRPNMAKGNARLGVFASPSLLVNGKLNPTITMRPGEVQLWRLVNATIKAVATMDGFSPTNGTTLPEYRQTAQDGVQFGFDNFNEQPILNYQGTGQARPNSFAPGNRIDFLVRAPAVPDAYQFRLVDSTNGPSDILTLVVKGDPLPMEFPTRDNYPVLPDFLNDIQANDTIPGPTNPAKPPRTVEFGWDHGPTPDQNGNAPQLTIDNKKFDGQDYGQEMVLGAVEEWTLTNSTTIAHPFHIHVNPFQVVEIFDPDAGTRQPPTATTYKPSQNYIWQDVIAIPPATFNGDGTVKEKGRVTIRHRFVDFVGSYVLHCHMLAHEDRGMMQLVRVVATEADLGKKQVLPHH
jgi:FtsP/CotA-like multicopper oxidase with cupredoxin domain